MLYEDVGRAWKINEHDDSKKCVELELVGRKTEQRSLELSDIRRKVAKLLESLRMSTAIRVHLKIFL